MKIIILLLLTFTTLYAQNWPDLERDPSPFILSTKKIDIPGFKYAFNPSIVRYEDKFLMSFRVRDLKTNSTHQMGLVFLDHDFNPIGKPQIIDLHFKALNSMTVQDPRLIYAGNDLYVVFNHWTERQMCISKLEFKEGKFTSSIAERISQYEGFKKGRVEKNWVPFAYDNHLLLAYSIVPHLIFQPKFGTGICETFATSKSNSSWAWGELRGGTPALKVDDEYLAFFHSSKMMTSANSKGQFIKHYFMGAYTFEAIPPFALTKMSSKPIIGKNFYKGHEYKTWKPLLVVFPAGYVFDEKNIWIAYGRQDHEIWIAKLDKEALLKSLKPVN